MESIKFLMSLIDTLCIGFYLKENNLTEEDFQYLDDCKQRARDQGFKTLGLIEFKGKYWHITSAKKIYRYVLYNDDLTIKIARNLSNGIYPEVFVEFRSRLLMGGLKDAYLIAREWIEKWAVIAKEKVSRADIAADFQGVIKINRECVVTRSRKNKADYKETRNGFRIETYTYGSHNMLLRTYDKTVEIEVKGKQYMKPEWLQKGWDGEKPVWRVEGQLAREALKEFQVETLQDLIDHAPDIWRYLTTEWFTVREKSETDSTRSRWAISAMWKIIQDSFRSLGELTGIVREKIRHVRLDNIVPQVAGLVTSCMALLQRGEIDFTELMRLIARNYRKKGKTIEQVIEEKMQGYALFEEMYPGAL